MGKKVFKSIDEILRTYHRELCLRTPCAGSKFQILQVINEFDYNYNSDDN